MPFWQFALYTVENHHEDSKRSKPCVKLGLFVIPSKAIFGQFQLLSLLPCLGCFFIVKTCLCFQYFDVCTAHGCLHSSVIRYHISLCFSSSGEWFSCFSTWSSKKVPQQQLIPICEVFVLLLSHGTSDWIQSFLWLVLDDHDPSFALVPSWGLSHLQVMQVFLKTEH